MDDRLCCCCDYCIGFGLDDRFQSLLKDCIDYLGIGCNLDLLVALDLSYWKVLE